jgi:hypothetical protein
MMFGSRPVTRWNSLSWHVVETTAKKLGLLRPPITSTHHEMVEFPVVVRRGKLARLREVGDRERLGHNVATS